MMKRGYGREDCDTTYGYNSTNQGALAVPCWRQVQLLWGSDEPMSALILALFARHGMPEAVLEELTKHMESFVLWVAPQPQVTLLREGPVRLGDRVYEAIETPGHAAGHLCFYDAEAEAIFCGDHVLPQISPNVGFIPQVEANPLGAYLRSLQDIGRLQVGMAYPGTGSHGRISARAQPS